MAKLFITLADSGQMTHQLAGDVITVGRYPDNMIQINHASVSGHHARLVARNGRYHLQDLNSTVKSYVNGMPSSEADLPVSCILRFGAVECVFKDEVASSPIDQYVTRLAESQRQTDAVIRARDFLHQQLQDLQKQKDAAVRASEESAFEAEELRKQVAALKAEASGHNGDTAPSAEQLEDLRRLASELETARQEQSVLSGKLEEAVKERDAAQKGGESLAGALQETKQIYKATVGERNALQKQCEELRERAAALGSECEAAELGNKGMALALEEARKQIDGFRKEREELAAGLENQQKASGENFEQVSAQLAEERARNEALLRDRNAAEQGHEGLSEALNDARRQIEQEREALQAARKQADSQLAEQRARISSLEEERDEQRRASEKTARQLAEACSEIELFGKLREAAQQNSQQYAAQFEEARKQLEGTIQERDAARRDRGELQEKLERQREELAAESLAQRAETASQLEKSRLEIAALTGQRDAFREQGERAAASLAEARDQFETLAKQRGSNRQEIESIRMDRDSLKEQQADWAARLEQARKQNAALTDERNQAREAGDKAAAALAEAEGRLKHLKAERDASLQAARELAEGRKQLEAANAERDSLRERVQELMAKLKEQPQDKTIEQFHSVIAKKEEEIARLKHEMKKPAEEPGLRLERPAPVEKAPPLPAGSAQPGETAEGRSIPALLSAMRNRLHYFIRHPGDHALMEELVRHAAAIAAESEAAGCSHKLAKVLEGMVRDLSKRPELANPALLRTLSQAVDFLITLQEGRNVSRANSLPRGSIFVVDDDPGILDAIVPSLEQADVDVSCAEQAKKGLKILSDKKFDLVLLDVGLPEMNGMDLCTKIRNLPHQKKTPIVFLTGMDTVQNRVQSMLSGGNDFIGKPFNTWELAAKALIWVLKGQLALT